MELNILGNFLTERNPVKDHLNGRTVLPTLVTLKITSSMEKASIFGQIKGTTKDPGKMVKWKVKEK